MTVRQRPITGLVELPLAPANPPKVCIFIPNFGDGGVERMLVNLACGFSKQGVAVDFIVNHTDVPYLDALPSQVRVIALNAVGGLMSLFRLIRYLQQERPAVLLSAKGSDDRIAVRAKRLAGMPTRVVLRVGTSIASRLEVRRCNRIRKWLRHRALRRLYARADGVIAVSRGVAEELVRIARVPPQRVLIIPNPVVSPSLYHLAAQPIRHPWFVHKDRLIIVSAGRLTRAKDYPTLVRAFAELRARRPARLVILGEGGQRSRLEALIRALGLQDDVDLPGFIENPYNYLANADLFVLSSAWEGSPSALAEALALGTPVVATDCPSGPRELLQDGRYGPLVPVGDVHALAEAMARTLDQPMAGTALKSAVHAYTIEESAHQHLKVLGLGDARSEPRAARAG
jgi:glycosyltransferase involved in cell wall biosynthesis